MNWAFQMQFGGAPALFRLSFAFFLRRPPRLVFEVVLTTGNVVCFGAEIAARSSSKKGRQPHSNEATWLTAPA